jgi:hypothetical protein
MAKMYRLSAIAQQVLAEYGEQPLHESLRIEIAQKIEERWKNYIKDIAKSEIMQKATEAIQTRTGIIQAPPADWSMKGK